MQARKLSLAEAHPSQVVKVEVDAASQTAALLLRDSSCLLFPSLSGTSPPLLIPPSSTDICFLRLRQRTTAHISSSSSSDKSAEASSRSDFPKLANVKSKPSMDPPEKIGDALPRFASVVDATAGSVSEALLFLSLKPAKGGVCTDLIAWRCCDLGFFQMSILLEGSLDGCNGASIARLDGIPHGISAGIAASVNVVVVHSPAVGKLWIYSAKYSKGEHSSTKSDGTEPWHTHTKDSVLNNAVKDASNLDREDQEKEKHSCLHLFKCAVVDCNGPVYALHLSLQHLLVGQLGGVRVWLLRPLIKGSAVARKDFKATHHYGRCVGAKQERNKILEDQECGKKLVETHRCSNGQHSAAAEGIGTSRTWRGPCSGMTAPKNGFYEMSVLQCDGTKIVPTNGFNSTAFSKKQGCGCSDKPSEDILSSLNGCSKKGMNSDVQEDASSDAPKLVQFEEAIVPAYKNGISFEFDLEETKSQQKLSQSSMFLSSSDSSSSLPLPYTTCARSASCQSSSSSLSSVVGASGTTIAYHKTEAGKGAQAGVFVSLFKNQSSLSMFNSPVNIEQVTSIHGVSEKDFVVLDSDGKLHLLNLQYLARGDEAKLHRAPRILLNASLQPLTCGIKIKFLTVLPDLHSNKRSSDFASRVLWVSDGRHTVYIVAVRTGESSKEGSGKTHFMSKSYSTVIGTVFLTERALLLSALHENAVMVFTEGSMVAYSSTGT